MHAEKSNFSIARMACSSTRHRPVRSRCSALAWMTAEATAITRVRALPPGGPTRTDDDTSTNNVQRTGTSLSNSLVINRSRRADAFHAIIFGGSPGK